MHARSLVALSNMTRLYPSCRERCLGVMFATTMAHTFSTGCATGLTRGSSLASLRVSWPSGIIVLPLTIVPPSPRRSMGGSNSNTDLAAKWYKKLVPFGIDNMAFERSAAKGRSAAARLNDLLRGLFVLQVKFTFILQPYWISSADNYLADELSRGRVAVFLDQIYDSGFLQQGAVLFARPGAGRVVTLSDNPYHDAASSLREFIRAESLRDEPSLRDSPRSDGSARSDPVRLRKNGMPPRNRTTMHLRGAGGSGKSPARQSRADILFFTFTRTEVPCPKNFSGPDGFNPGSALAVP